MPAAETAATPEGSPEGSSAAETVTVEIKDFTFTPATLEIPVGTTVTWINQDSSPHNVIAEDGSIDSGLLDQGESYSYTFEEPGTYAYTCTFHPYMQATIVVGDAIDDGADGDGEYGS